MKNRFMEACARNVALLLWALFALFPLVWMLIISFKSDAQMSVKIILAENIYIFSACWLILIAIVYIFCPRVDVNVCKVERRLMSIYSPCCGSPVGAVR